MDINQFAVYQLKNIPENRQIRFRPYSTLQEKGIQIRCRDYEQQNSRRNSPLFGNSTLSGCPSTWNPAEKDIKTTPPQSGAGRTPTKRRRNRLPGTGITA